MARLTQAQHKYIQELLTGKNIAHAALSAGVSRRSAIRWLQNNHPVYLEYEKRRLQLQDDFSARIAQLHELSIAALKDALTSKYDWLRFSAAKLLYQAHLQAEGTRVHPESVESLLNTEVRDIRYGLSREAYMQEAFLSDDPLSYFREMDGGQDE